MKACSDRIAQVKLYSSPPLGLEGVIGELHSVPSSEGKPIVIKIPDEAMQAVFRFLKDAQVRFKVLEPDGSAREWSPSRMAWMECEWDDEVCSPTSLTQR
jgi:hypothetical protein